MQTLPIYRYEWVLDNTAEYLQIVWLFDQWLCLAHMFWRCTQEHDVHVIQYIFVSTEVDSMQSAWAEQFSKQLT